MKTLPIDPCPYSTIASYAPEHIRLHYRRHRSSSRFPTRAVPESIPEQWAFCACDTAEATLPHLLKCPITRNQVYQWQNALEATLQAAVAQCHHKDIQAEQTQQTLETLFYGFFPAPLYKWLQQAMPPKVTRTAAKMLITTLQHAQQITQTHFLAMTNATNNWELSGNPRAEQVRWLHVRGSEQPPPHTTSL